MGRRALGHPRCENPYMATPATSMQASSASVRQVPYLAQVALIAAAYFAVARLSLALAIPPSSG